MFSLRCYKLLGLVCVLLMLSACGQKGPLYLPQGKIDTIQMA